MTAPDATGKRFLTTSAETSSSWWEIVQVLRRRFPSLRLPDHEAAGPDVPPKAFRLDRIRTILGWKPRSPEETIVATAESLLAQGTP